MTALPSRLLACSRWRVRPSPMYLWLWRCRCTHTIGTNGHVGILGMHFIVLIVLRTSQRHVRQRAVSSPRRSCLRNPLQLHHFRGKPRHRVHQSAAVASRRGQHACRQRSQEGRLPIRRLVEVLLCWRRRGGAPAALRGSACRAAARPDGQCKSVLQRSTKSVNVWRDHKVQACIR